MKIKNSRTLTILKWIFLLLVYPFIFLLVLINLVDFIFSVSGYSYGIKYHQLVPNHEQGYCKVVTNKKRLKEFNEKFCLSDTEFLDWTSEQGY
jgi:hypothetical protein